MCIHYKTGGRVVMTAVQHGARLFGWLFVLIAIWGAVLAGTSMEADPAVAVRLWGLFPVNFLHNLVHLLLGLWGISASRSHAAARVFALGAGAVYLALAALGLVTPSGFGLVPLGGHDIWLHALLGVLLIGAGIATAQTRTETIEPVGTRTVRPPATSAGDAPASPEPDRET